MMKTTVNIDHDKLRRIETDPEGFVIELLENIRNPAFPSYGLSEVFGVTTKKTENNGNSVSV